MPHIHKKKSISKEDQVLGLLAKKRDKKATKWFTHEEVWGDMDNTKKNMKKQKGKLIVIDGTDGSGKSTQLALLMDHLQKDGRKFKTIKFPDYSNNFFGSFIGQCLSDEKYNFVHIHPKIVSALYAADRSESKKKIEKWLADGYVVLADRYVCANQIHPGGKIHNTKERKEFLTWLDKMEYEIFNIPRPDVVLYLSLPMALIQKLIKARDEGGEKRAYLQKKKDVHESDPKHLEDARKSALKLIKELNNFVQIDCAPKKELLSRETIHDMVYTEVKKILK